MKCNMCTKNTQWEVTSKITFASGGNIWQNTGTQKKKRKEKHVNKKKGWKRGESLNSVWDKKGQAVNKQCDILDTIHKVARYIDGSLLLSQNGCQIC